MEVNSRYSLMSMITRMVKLERCVTIKTSTNLWSMISMLLLKY